MEKDTHITPVIFRRAKKRDGGQIEAFFPATPGTSEPWTCACYAHIGQHSTAHLDYFYATNPLAPSDADDVAELRRELESFGYNLREYKRITQAMHDARMVELNRNNCNVDAHLNH